MSVQYKPVIWDRSKYVYDFVLLLAVALYLYVYLFVAVDYGDHVAAIDRQVLRMRAFGTCAFFMLSLILMIGPLARLDRRFLPLLYNRRHFGVMTATVAAAHAYFVLEWYFHISAFGAEPSWEAVLTTMVGFDRALGFPIEFLGALTLLVLVILAVTSHDFWMSFLTPPVWKALHMLIYPAYALVVAHIAFGYLQDAKDSLFPLFAVVCAAVVAGLHVASAVVDARASAKTRRGAHAQWLDAGALSDILAKTPDGRATILALPNGERVALYHDAGRLGAISNVCAHQNGPLGEGRILGGCVTCPWHGHQFRLTDGCAPAPFTDKVPVHPVKIENARVYVAIEPAPLGTAIDLPALPAAAQKESAA